MKSVMQLIEEYYMNKLIFIYEFESCGIKSFHFDLENIKTPKMKLIGQSKVVSVSNDYVKEFKFDDNCLLKFYAHLENGQIFEIDINS